MVASHTPPYMLCQWGLRVCVYARVCTHIHVSRRNASNASKAMRRAKESKRMNGFDSDSYSLAVCVCRYCRWRERVFRRFSLIPLHRAADSTLPNVTYCAATKRAANRMCSMCVCVNEMNILCCTFFPCLLH